MSKSGGFFLTGEGGEGSGKTTQMRMLRKYIEDERYSEVTLTREPGGLGCTIAERIRGILLDPESANIVNKAEFLLFLAARAQHVQEIILPALERGEIVLADRFYDSAWTYQMHTRKAVTPEDFDTMNTWAITHLDKVIRPNLTILFDVAVETGHKRAQVRNMQSEDESETRVDNEAMIFHRTVNEGYRLLAAKYPERIFVIDANRSIEEIHVDVCKLFKNKYVQWLEGKDEISCLSEKYY